MSAPAVGAPLAMRSPAMRNLRSSLCSLILSACVGALLLPAAGCDKLLPKKATKAESDSESEEDRSERKKKTEKDSDGDDGVKKPKGDREADGAAPSQPTGRFVYKPQPPTKAEHQRFQPLFEDARFSGVVKAMEVFALPRDVAVLTGDVGPCAQPNAFYMPSKHVVFLCHTLAKISYENFVAMGKSDQEASNLTRDAMTFVLLHELGHALIGELGLGVTGKEEDAVDELAALILIENDKHDMAIAGPYALVLLKEFQGKGKQTPFFDEHAASEARLYDMFCMILGSNPKRFAEEILKDRPEMKQRAPKCPATYQKIDKAWTGLLAPHKRSGNARDDD